MNTSRVLGITVGIPRFAVEGHIAGTYVYASVWSVTWR